MVFFGGRISGFRITCDHFRITCDHKLIRILAKVWEIASGDNINLR